MRMLSEDPSVPRSDSERGRRVRTVLACLVIGGVALVLGCSPNPEPAEADLESIQQLLAEYLPRMGAAYESGDLTPLEGLASEKEIASLRKRIDDLWNGEGRAVRAELVEFEIEEVKMLNYSTAFVTTLETWNLTVKAAGTDQVLSEVRDQRNRVRYQLDREGDSWKVLSRDREATFE